MPLDYRCDYFTDKNCKLILKVAALIAFFFLFALGPKEYPDTAEYINGGLVLPTLYPIVIDVFRIVFKGYYGYGMMAFQLVFGGWAVYFISRFIARLYSLPPCALLILVALIASPYFGITIQTGNALLTEGLAYPLFLFATVYLLDGVTSLSFRSIIVFILLSALLVLTRKQFAFMFPIGLIAIIYYAFKTDARKGAAYLSLLLVVSWGAENFIERANNYFRSGQFASFSYAGGLLLGNAIYISKQSDINAIQDKQQALFFQEIYNESSRKRLTLESLEDVEKDLDVNFYGQYFINYHNLINVGKVALNKVYSSEMRTEVERAIVTDSESKKLAMTLIRENPKSYAKLYFLNVTYGLGGHGIGDGYGVRGSYFAILQLVMVLLVLAHSIRIRRVDPLASSVLLIFLLHLASVAETAILLPVGDRYSFYTSTLMMAIIFAFVAKGVEAKMPDPGSPSKD